MSELYLPFLMSEDELFETIENVDFWGDSPTENDFAIVEEIHARNGANSPSLIDESNENDSFLRELASIRGMIIERIGFGHFQNVLKYGENHVNTPKKRALFDSIAESINENSFLYSEQFFQKYSNCGNVDFGHICEIIANEKSYSELEKELTAQQVENMKENESIIESYYTENTAENIYSDADFDWSTGEYTTVYEHSTPTLENLENQSKVVIFPIFINNVPCLIDESEPKLVHSASGDGMPNPMIFSAVRAFLKSKLHSLSASFASIALFVSILVSFAINTVKKIFNQTKTGPVDSTKRETCNPFTIDFEPVLNSVLSFNRLIVLSNRKTTYLSTIFKIDSGPPFILSG